MPVTDLNLQIQQIAISAGKFIARERIAFNAEKVEAKGLNDLVSYVDRTAESMIVDGLSQLLPEAGFLVEENTRSGQKKINWIVDPLDGTTNFIHGIPCYAVSIALENEGIIEEGVVFEVSRGECFSASKARGAFLNDVRIKTSEAANLSDCLIATGFPVQNFERIKPFFKALETLLRNTHGVRRIGAAAADLCYLACGRFDGFFEYNLKPWDVAAGALIVKEAGGTVCDFSGQSDWLFGREMLASNGIVDQEFLDLVRSAFHARS